MQTQAEIRSPAAPDDRRTQRVPLEARITMASQSNFWTGFSENLSEGGVFVATPNPPAVGELVPVHIQTEDGRAVLIWGEVRWLREEEGGSYSGCGIQFLNLDSRGRLILGDMMMKTGQEPLLMEF